MASSKSRASTGSIVTTTSPVKSRRPFNRVSSNCSACRLASRSTDSGNGPGRPNSATTVRVSTPGSPLRPSTSTITPSPSTRCVGNRTISKITLSPECAPLAPGSPTAIGRANPVPSTWTKPTPATSKALPTKRVVRRRMIRVISPDGPSRRTSC